MLRHPFLRPACLSSLSEGGREGGTADIIVLPGKDRERRCFLNTLQRHRVCSVLEDTKLVARPSLLRRENLVSKP